MSIFLNILIIIGILISTTCSFYAEKEKRFRSLIILGAIVAIGALFAQIIIKYHDDKEHRGELLEARRRYDEQKSQSNSLHEKVDILTNENQKLKDIITKPKLEFLKDRTQQTVEEKTGKVKSIYVYRSQYPTVIRNAMVKLTFNKPILGANIRTTGTLPFKDNLQSGFNSSKKLVLCSVKQLGEGGELVIEVFSDDPLKIVSNEFSP